MTKRQNPQTYNYETGDNPEPIKLMGAMLNSDKISTSQSAPQAKRPRYETPTGPGHDVSTSGTGNAWYEGAELVPEPGHRST